MTIVEPQTGQAGPALNWARHLTHSSRGRLLCWAAAWAASSRGESSATRVE